MSEFEIIIIGGGPGGVKAAKMLATAGKKVALVSDDLGGECLNYGCIPTKTYLWTAELFEKISQAANFGIDVSGAKLNWQRMKERRTDVVAKLKKNLKWGLERAGVTIIEGHGELVDSHTIKITDLQATSYNIQTNFIILATGSTAVFPPGFEPSEKILSNHEILDLAEIPKTLLIIGGGAVGVEFASVFAVLGTKVTIAEAADRLLPQEDSDVSAELERVFLRKGIEILKNKRVEPAETQNFEKVLVAIGRKSMLSPFEKASNIFVIGDALGKAMLAYTAEREGEIAALQILGKNPAPIKYETVPNTIFCLPEIASVGLTEDEAKKRGIDYAVGKGLASANSKALILGSRDGFAKIIAEKSSHKILGIHIIGEKASELIAEASLAITVSMTLETFAENFHSHPILGEILKEAAETCLTAFTKG